MWPLDVIASKQGSFKSVQRVFERCSKGCFKCVSRDYVTRVFQVSFEGVFKEVSRDF